MTTTLARSGAPGQPPAPTQDRLRAHMNASREPGEASFFFYDAPFKAIAVRALPGEYFVSGDTDLLIMTTLGSCIAVCLWDRQAGVGGLNHFMLPDGGTERDSGRYGSFAMELLINAMMKRGASRRSLEAKVFGGGQVIEGMPSMNIGEQNTRFALDYLKTERIPVVSQDVLDAFARKVCFMPAVGKAMVKRLAPTTAQALGELDQAAARQRTLPPTGGSIDLF